MKRKATIFMFFVLISSHGNANWSIEARIFMTTNVLYSIHSSNLETVPGYYFTNFDTAYTSGYQLKFIFQKQKGINKKLQAKLTINEPIDVYNDSTHLELLTYLEGISNYSLIFTDVANNQCSINIEVKNEKYQFPLYYRMSDVRKTIISSDTNVHKMKEILFIIEPKNKEQFRFVIGDLKIANRRSTWKKVYHPLFDPIAGTNSLELMKKDSFSAFGDVPFLHTNMAWYSEPIDGNLFLRTDEPSYEPRDLLFNVFDVLFNNYPFYDEKGLSKEEILGSLKRLQNDTLNYTDAIIQITKLVSGFHDPHFFIPKKESPPADRLFDPIGLFELNGEVSIAAIYDTLLTKNSSLNVGDKIFAINDIQIRHLIDSLSVNYTGTLSVRRNKALSGLFKIGADDSLKVQFRTNEGFLSDVYLKPKRNIHIPSNFIPVHGDFKKKNGVCYFRINNFERYTWIHFLNHFDDFKKSKGIIFDIRGNGGGDEGTVLKILSTFISNPCVLLHSSILIAENNFNESVVIKPNPYVHIYQNIPKIVLLTDNRTACASELFAFSMRKHLGAQIISDSKTAGTYAWRTSLTFPDGFRIYHNCMVKPFFDNNFCIENNGLEPNIWVWKTKVADLYPYEDKVLKTAYKFFESYQ